MIHLTPWSATPLGRPLPFVWFFFFFVFFLCFMKKKYVFLFCVRNKQKKKRKQIHGKQEITTTQSAMSLSRPLPFFLFSCFFCELLNNTEGIRSSHTLTKVRVRPFTKAHLCETVDQGPFLRAIDQGPSLRAIDQCPSLRATNQGPSLCVVKQSSVSASR